MQRFDCQNDCCLRPVTLEAKCGRDKLGKLTTGPIVEVVAVTLVLA